MDKVLQKKLVTTLYITTKQQKHYKSIGCIMNRGNISLFVMDTFYLVFLLLFVM